MPFSQMSIGIKNGFIHIAEGEHNMAATLRRTRSCDVSLADWCAFKGASVCRKSGSLASLGSASTLSVNSDRECTSDADTESLAGSTAGSTMSVSVIDSSYKATAESTIVFKHLPTSLTQRSLVRLLLNAGFAGCFDFVFLPMRPKDFTGMGYAFVRFTHTDYAQHAIEAFNDVCILTSKTRW